MTFIRPARPNDLETIVEFQLRMALETEGLSLEKETVTQGVRAVMEGRRHGQYYLAETGGRVVGCLLTLPEWSDWRNGTILWIHSLYVLPEHRRRGVFRSLYGHLRKMAEADPALKGLRLYVDRRNVAAKKVYEAMGMDAQHYELYEWLK
jgi:ribosomal protein S18 acetylase RimI-like enzyme